MSEQRAISEAVIRRLPKYYRYITLIQNKGIVRISSQNLSEITGFTASQIRQDLNHFGGFGQQGYGYNVAKLKEQLSRIIGIDKEYNMIIAGAGRMGQAISNSELFKSPGFCITALFDVDKEKIGNEIDGATIYHTDDLAKYIAEHKVDIVAITTPKEVAQKIADVAVEAGVQGIWNFATIDLKLPDNVVLENVHLDESLHTLIYYLGSRKDYTRKQ